MRMRLVRLWISAQQDIHSTRTLTYVIQLSRESRDPQMDVNMQWCISTLSRIVSDLDNHQGSNTDILDAYIELETSSIPPTGRPYIGARLGAYTVRKVH